MSELGCRISDVLEFRTRAKVPGKPHRPRGFTLLETALAMVIVLVGVLAMIEAQGSFIQANGWSSHEATATYLAGEIRERMRTLPRHDPVTGLSMVNVGGTPTLQGLGREANEITVNDFDDVDDYNGITFGRGGNFDGPIDAFGRIIAQTDGDGTPLTGSDGRPLPLQGWSQSVLVQKMDPFNYATVLPWNTTAAVNGAFPGRAVDQYPLRVTVTVFYQGDFDAQPQSVTSMSWIVPVN
jgi:prepilin-type N-terminal cleavage/methylation domain-containing protein